MPEIDDTDLAILRFLVEADGPVSSDRLREQFNLSPEELEVRRARLRAGGLISERMPTTASPEPLPTVAESSGVALVNDWVDYAIDHGFEPRSGFEFVVWLREQGQLPDDMPDVAAALLIRVVAGEALAAEQESLNEEAARGD